MRGPYDRRADLHLILELVWLGKILLSCRVLFVHWVRSLQLLHCINKAVTECCTCKSTVQTVDKLDKEKLDVVIDGAPSCKHCHSYLECSKTYWILTCICCKFTCRRKLNSAVPIFYGVITNDTWITDLCADADNYKLSTELPTIIFLTDIQLPIADMCWCW